MAIFPDRECPRPPREQLIFGYLLQRLLNDRLAIAVDRCHRSREALDRLAIAEEIVCRDGNIDGPGLTIDVAIAACMGRAHISLRSCRPPRDCSTRSSSGRSR